MAYVPKMKTEASEGLSAPKPSPLPNFRRFSRVYPNASDTSKEDPVIERFLVITLPDFEEEVRFPPQFCRELRDSVPSDAILISYKGMWRIDFGRCPFHMDFALSGGGWSNFVRNHNLEKDNLIWFEQTDLMVFRVHVFDLNAAGEKFSSENGQARHGSILGHVVPGCNYGGHHRHGFPVNIEDHHFKKSFLTIPADFVKRKDDLKEKERAVLVNSSGHAWEVELGRYLNPRLAEQSQRHVVMRRGWLAFVKANSLQIGDVCNFYLDVCSPLASPDSSVMSVRIVRTI